MMTAERTRVDVEKVEDRYADMTREQLDAEMQSRVESLADALAFARSGHLHDDEIRRVLLLLDLARKGEW